MSTKISLLPDESVVMSSDQDILTLTTRRVRYDSAAPGSSNFISITLNSVASCGLITKSYAFLPVLGTAVALFGVFQRGSEQIAALAFAGVLIVAYFLTRKAVISIASNGGQTILVPAKGMNRKTIVEFLEAIEREKLKNSNVGKQIS